MAIYVSHNQMLILLRRLGPLKKTKVYQGHNLPTKWDDPPSNMPLFMTAYGPAANPKKRVSDSPFPPFRGKVWASLATTIQETQEITDDLIRIDLAYFIFPDPKKNWNQCRHVELATAPFLLAQSKAFLWQELTKWTVTPCWKVPENEVPATVRDCANSSINMYQSIYSIVPWMDISWMD